MNAFDFKFGSKISLRGPETVRKTHSSTSSSSTSSTSSSSTSTSTSTSSSSTSTSTSSSSSCSSCSSRSSSSSRGKSRSRNRSRNRSRSSSSRAREEREREGKREREREREGGGKQMVAFGRFLTGFWLVSDWFLTLQRDSCQLDLKAKAEIPRCTSGSGGAVAAGVVVVLRVVANLVMRVRIHAWTHSISNLGAK